MKVLSSYLVFEIAVKILKKIPWENSNCFTQNQKQLFFCGNVKGIISTTDNSHGQINFSRLKIF